MKQKMILSVLTSVFLVYGSLAWSEDSVNAMCSVTTVKFIPPSPFSSNVGQIGYLTVKLACSGNAEGLIDGQAFISAPLSEMTTLSLLQINSQMSSISVAGSFYSGKLISIDGRKVGEQQPTERTGLSFNKGIYDELSGGKLESILKGSRTAKFEAQDSFRFKIFVEFNPSRSVFGKFHHYHTAESWRLRVVGSLEINQQAGDSLQLSEWDSENLSTFLEFDKFPVEFDVTNTMAYAKGTALISCQSANQCQYKESK